MTNIVDFVIETSIVPGQEHQKDPIVLYRVYQDGQLGLSGCEIQSRCKQVIERQMGLLVYSIDATATLEVSWGP